MTQCPNLCDNQLFIKAVGLFGVATKAAKEALRHIWHIGRLLGELSQGYGEGMVLEEYAQRINRSVRTVQRYRDIGKLTEGEFERALKSGYDSERKLLSLIGEKQRVRGDYREDTLRIVEEKESQIEGMALKLSEEVRELLNIKEHRELSKDVQMAVSVVVEAAKNEIMDAAQAIRAEVQIYRSERYLAFVRSLPCCVCGWSVSEPHHTETGGMAIKGSDTSCIPLCTLCHQQVHVRGMDFWFENRIEVSRIGWNVARRYIEVVIP